MVQTGSLLDNTYEVRKQIGEGGGGEIYLAWHTRLHKDVVVKRIREAVKGVFDSRAEADILKNLKHRYLPQAYDFLELDGEIYTVMDFIPGENFARELEMGKTFTPKQVVRWAGQLCEALEYLHGQHPPIIHSDIKPANIMLTPDGDICLIDFNISQLFRGGGCVPLGRTDGYAAPEQYPELAAARVRGKPAAPDKTELLRPDATEVLEPDGAAARRMPAGAMPQMDERTDIYSLGATLYHLATGQRPLPPYQGGNDLSPYRAAIGEGLARILEKAMMPDPQKRFSSASEMLRAIRNIHKMDRTYKRQVRRQELATGFFILLFTLSALCCINGWETMRREQEDWYRQTVEQSLQLTGERRFDEARELAELAQASRPAKPDAHRAKALALYQSGEYEACLDALRAAQEAVSGSAKAQELPLLADLDYLKASCHFALEDYAAASVSYEAALSKSGDNSGYYRDYAICEAHLGHTERAREILRDAVNRGLDTPGVLLAEGEIARSEGSYRTAVDAFLQAARTTASPEIALRAYLLCAKTQEQAGEPAAQTAEMLQTAAAALPDSDQYAILEELGEACSRAGKQTGDESWYRKALDCFQELINRGYSRFYLMNNVAILHQTLGEYGEAEQTLLQMKEKFPDNYRVYMQLAFLYADQQLAKETWERDYRPAYENYELAMQAYQGLAENHADDPQMLMLEDLMEEIKEGGWLE